MFEQSNRLAINIETSTAWWIARSEFTMASYINLKSKLSTLDFQDQEKPVAFFEYDLDGTPYVVIPKIQRKLLEFILGRRLRFQRSEYEDLENATYKKPKFDPLPHQEPILEKAEKVWRDEGETDKRICISIPPGGGKSFCAAYLAWKMKAKFIFIVYSGKLVKQTWENFCGFLGREGMLMLEKGSDFPDIRWDKVKGLFITHSMIRSLSKTYSFEYVINVLQEKMGAKILIMDEFDRETGSCYKLDAFTDFPYNLRLTGTTYRSLKPDDQVFQTVYRHCHMLGNEVQLEKKRTLHLINWKFNPTPKEYTKMMLFEERLFKNFYVEKIAQKDILLDFIMNQFYKKEDSIIKQMFDDNGQVVIYAGRIENCQIVKKKLIDNFEIDENDIGVYNSDISDREKDEAEKKKWIITTMSSLGRGYDNKNIRVLIYLEFSFSSSEFEQTCSRCSRIGGKPGHVIYGLDHSFWKVENNWNKKVREGLIDKHFKQVFNYTIPDSWKDYYVYGYRRTSAMAAEIMKEQKERERTLKWSKRI